MLRGNTFTEITAWIEKRPVQNSCALFSLHKFYQKNPKTLSKHWWSLENFCCSPNNCKSLIKQVSSTRINLEVKSVIVARPLRVVSQAIIQVFFNNANRLFICHLNVNSLRNNLEMLQEIVQDKLDIVLVSETKVDPSFPEIQFAIEVFRSWYHAIC